MPLTSSIHARSKILSVAIYTRKSSAENLDLDFTSLDAQRTYCQTFIRSREAEGWTVYPEEYNDAGISGSTLKRPALQRLLADARERKFQVVVAYKYDRLSRNTKDFLQILDIFESHDVAFVSVTQPIDTTSCIGRLMRSILMDFAQFEREMVSERTRDKIAAMVQQGKRVGGFPVLGYDIAPDTRRWAVNLKESKAVSFIFTTYATYKSLSVTARLAQEQGYRMKEWVTRSGIKSGGMPFNKTNISLLLHNPIYIGQIRHHGKSYPGEHQGIIDASLFHQVQHILKTNDERKKSPHQGKYPFLLKGLVRCAVCNSVMTPTFTSSRYGRRYFYYKCVAVNKLDKSACTIRSLHARELEQTVIDKLAGYPHQIFIQEIASQAERMKNDELPSKWREKDRLITELEEVTRGITNLTAILEDKGISYGGRGPLLDALDRAVQEKDQLQLKIRNLEKEISDLDHAQMETETLQQALWNFKETFETMDFINQQNLMLRLIKEIIVYDKTTIKVHLNFGNKN